MCIEVHVYLNQWILIVTFSPLLSLRIFPSLFLFRHSLFRHWMTWIRSLPHFKARKKRHHSLFFLFLLPLLTSSFQEKEDSSALITWTTSRRRRKRKFCWWWTQKFLILFKKDLFLERINFSFLLQRHQKWWTEEEERERGKFAVGRLEADLRRRKESEKIHFSGSCFGFRLVWDHK